MSYGDNSARGRMPFVDMAAPKLSLAAGGIRALMVPLGQLGPMKQKQPARVGRRLAAIVAPDVAGYWRLAARSQSSSPIWVEQRLKLCSKSGRSAWYASADRSSAHHQPSHTTCGISKTPKTPIITDRPTRSWRFV
jgi:hypothetical protein